MKAVARVVPPYERSACCRQRGPGIAADGWLCLERRATEALNLSWCKVLQYQSQSFISFAQVADLHCSPSFSTATASP
jgi:hypothetical protein